MSLLKQFNTYKLQWIPREQNSRADKVAGEVLQRNNLEVLELVDDLPVMLPRADLARQIQKIIEKGNSAGFKDFFKLKSGRDQFSKLSLEKLKSLVPTEINEAISARIKDSEGEDFTKQVLRWYLRGLPLPLAIMKVRVGSEVTANCRK